MPPPSSRYRLRSFTLLFHSSVGSLSLSFQLGTDAKTNALYPDIRSHVISWCLAMPTANPRSSRSARYLFVYRWPRCPVFQNRNSAAGLPAPDSFGVSVPAQSADLAANATIMATSTVLRVTAVLILLVIGYCSRHAEVPRLSADQRNSWRVSLRVNPLSPLALIRVPAF